jgi:polysaccharide export outer membrane protein
MKSYSRLLLLPLACALFSCVNTKKAVYFNDLTESSISSKIVNEEPIIQKKDLLSITVSSLNPEASQIFNSSNNSQVQAEVISGVSTLTSGYLVDSDGNIQFPVLGKIRAAGYTKKQLIDEISGQLIGRKLLIDPIVSVRYMNYKVTVLGEVGRPAVINVPTEKISLMEAIGLAGDITIYGRRDRVMVIREQEGGKKIARLDLNSSEIFTSEYYYLKSNDIVYVEANRNKVATTSRVNVWLPIVFSGLSLAAIIFDRFND